MNPLRRSGMNTPKCRLGILISLMCISALTLTFSACHKSPPTADEIYKKEASGVALLLTKYYYTLNLPNGKVFFFSGIDDDGSLKNMTTNLNEIKQHCAYQTGTAFFIDKEGTLLTNRHVVLPSIDESQAKSSIMNVMRSIKEYIESQMSELSDQYDELDEEKGSSDTETLFGLQQPDYERIQQIEEQQKELAEKYGQLKEMCNNLEDQIDPSGITIKPVCWIGLAYNDSYVETEDDFLKTNPCNLVRTSDKDDVDLALIQLRSNRTPENAYVFDLEGKAPENSSFLWVENLFSGQKKEEGKLEMNQKLYLIGYNAGNFLANTRRGIKVQMTSGCLTQLPDGERLLYSMPSIGGSSGSPVIDENGSLVGVNFAGMRNSDNFNFGIPLDNVRRFVNQ